MLFTKQKNSGTDKPRNEYGPQIFTGINYVYHVI